jgi:hypothetical protein
MEKERKELYIEDLASHGGPVSCVGVREGVGEALIGVVWAGLWSREIPMKIRVLTQSWNAEGETAGGVIASRWWALRGRRTQARTKLSMRENREVRSSPVGVGGCLVRDGSRGSGADAERAVGGTSRR